MNLVSIRVITKNVDIMVKFYEQLTQTNAIRYTEDFAEVKFASTTLAIGSVKTLAFFGGDSVAEAQSNKSVIIEFIVPDLEAEFERLNQSLELNVVQKPTLMPWGNKSLLLRDPDGNLVNLFTPSSAEALDRFSKD